MSVEAALRRFFNETRVTARSGSRKNAMGETVRVTVSRCCIEDLKATAGMQETRDVEPGWRVSPDG